MTPARTASTNATHAQVRQEGRWKVLTRCSGRKSREIRLKGATVGGDASRRKVTVQDKWWLQEDKFKDRNGFRIME